MCCFNRRTASDLDIFCVDTISKKHVSAGVGGIEVVEKVSRLHSHINHQGGAESRNHQKSKESKMYSNCESCSSYSRQVKWHRKSFLDFQKLSLTCF